MLPIFFSIFRLGFNFSLSKDVEELKMLLHTKDIELKKSNEEVVCIKEQEGYYMQI